MGACDTWNVEINILVYENEMFPLPAEFHFKIPFMNFLLSAAHVQETSV